MKKISFILTLILFFQTGLKAKEITYQEILENPTDLELNLNLQIIMLIEFTKK